MHFCECKARNRYVGNSSISVSYYHTITWFFWWRIKLRHQAWPKNWKNNHRRQPSPKQWHKSQWMLLKIKELYPSPTCSCIGVSLLMEWEVLLPAITGLGDYLLHQLVITSIFPKLADLNSKLILLNHKLKNYQSAALSPVDDSNWQLNIEIPLPVYSVMTKIQIHNIGHNYSIPKEQRVNSKQFQHH